MQGALGLALDGLRKFVRRDFAQSSINPGQMLAVQRVEFSIVRCAMFRSIPPAPITAFRSKQRFLGIIERGVGRRVLALLRPGVLRARVSLAGVPEKIPR